MSLLSLSILGIVVFIMTHSIMREERQKKEISYLTPVTVYGEILEGDSSLSPENQELIKGILNSINQAAALSRKLLDFSRQDSGGPLTTIELTGSIMEAANLIRLAVAEPPGENNHNQKKVLLTVSDTGCGISKEAMDKIFEPFYTTKRSGKGTGLGLSVIQNLMTSLGGQIQIESQLEKGTTFFLYFPQTDKNTVPGTSGPKLQKGGLDCDAVLTDYSMPSTNGLELCLLIRKQYPNIRLFLMSVITDNQFEYYAKNHCFEQFILKSQLSNLLPRLLAP